MVGTIIVQIGTIMYSYVFKGDSWRKDMAVTSMLVTDVGDQMCWCQV